MSEGNEERILELRIEAEERETLRYPETFREKAVELVKELKKAGWTQKKISEDLHSFANETAGAAGRSM